MLVVLWVSPKSLGAALHLNVFFFLVTLTPSTKMKQNKSTKIKIKPLNMQFHRRFTVLIDRLALQYDSDYLSQIVHQIHTMQIGNV